MSSTTVPDVQYSDDDGTLAICSGDHTGDANDGYGWTVVQAKKKVRTSKELTSKRKTIESERRKKTKEPTRIRGIKQVSFGIASAPYGVDFGVHPTENARRRWHQSPPLQ